jgi:hypothetical protein
VFCVRQALGMKKRAYNADNCQVRTEVEEIVEHQAWSIVNAAYRRERRADCKYIPADDTSMMIDCKYFAN